jgi:hypothetical protein
MRVRTTVVLAAVAAALLTGAAPARAADPGAFPAGAFPAGTFTWTLPGAGAPASSGTLTLGGTAPITNAAIALDLAPLAGIATLAANGAGGCTTSGTVVTCLEGDEAVGDADGSWAATVALTVTPLAGATAGTTVTIPLTTSADGLQPGHGTLAITFSAGPILAATMPVPALGQQGTAALGDRLPLEPVVRNAGSAATTALVFTFTLSHALAPGAYDNCAYAPFPEQDGVYVRCVVPASLAAGATVELSGFEATVPADAPGIASARVFVDANTPGSELPSTVTFSPRPHSGQSVTVAMNVGTPPADDPTDLSLPPPVEFGVTGGTHDAGVAPITVTGAVGSLQTIAVTLTNFGPNEMAAYSHDLARVWVAIPSWAKATTVPAGCQASQTDQGLAVERPVTAGPTPGYPYYYCVGTVSTLPVGESVTFAFGLQITAATGTDGSSAVWLDDGTNPANAAAPITLGTGVPSPSPSPSASTVPSAAPSSSPSAGVSVMARAGGRFPFTGSPWAVWALGGVVLTLIGVALLLLLRLRRPA